MVRFVTWIWRATPPGASDHGFVWMGADFGGDGCAARLLFAECGLGRVLRPRLEPELRSPHTDFGRTRILRTPHQLLGCSRNSRHLVREIRPPVTQTGAASNP